MAHESTSMILTFIFFLSISDLLKQHVVYTPFREVYRYPMLVSRLHINHLTLNKASWLNF